jgi:hypothetical protein
MCRRRREAMKPKIKIERCDICGCPQFTTHRRETHYKGCSYLVNFSCPKKKKFDMHKRIKQFVFEYTKSALAALQADLNVVKKIIVEDEVYECRWDCLGVAG